MNTLPDSVKPYKKTSLFSLEADTIPRPFLTSHSTKEGVWGVLHVIEGELVFCNDEADTKTTVAKDEQTVIAPTMKHHLEVSSPVAFYVEFYR